MADTRQCPFCKEEVKADAVLCKHCRSELTPERPPHGGTCPWCKEEIHPDALKCKHCGSMLVDARDASASSQALATGSGGCGCGGGSWAARAARPVPEPGGQGLPNSLCKFSCEVLCDRLNLPPGECGILCSILCDTIAPGGDGPVIAARQAAAPGLGYNPDHYGQRCFRICRRLGGPHSFCETLCQISMPRPPLPPIETIYV